VLNASLQGVLHACRDYADNIDKLYTAFHGVEGILTEQLIDMSAQPEAELDLLRYTPSAGAIGTCRYKLLPDQGEDFQRIIDICRAHDIGYFFYNGGNDSMDTAHKLSNLAHEQDLDLTVVGIPKTIDNDVGDPEFELIDHTPGYGSTARYWTSIIQDVNEENRGMSPSECVCVLQTMGRKSGFIPAASRLADPNREMPLQIYTAESGHTLESLAHNVNRQLQKAGRCIVVVSEGFDVGSLGEAHDGFGHIEYGASQLCTAQVVSTYLNEQGLSIRGQSSWQMPNVLQRSTGIYASMVDIEEAYQVARHAVRIAIKDGNGWMATILRKAGQDYCAYYDKVPLEKVANSVRHLPKSWLTADELDVTDDFIRYAQPLIGSDWPPIQIQNGRQRYARLDVKFIGKKLPHYTPIRCR
jgi:6-phosphofructokinase 1